MWTFDWLLKVTIVYLWRWMNFALSYTTLSNLSFTIIFVNKIAFADDARLLVSFFAMRNYSIVNYIGKSDEHNRALLERRKWITFHGEQTVNK